jgi:hypothetical protein
MFSSLLIDSIDEWLNLGLGSFLSEKSQNLATFSSIWCLFVGVSIIAWNSSL